LLDLWGGYRDPATQAPFWDPGTRNGYHMMSFGWTVGELVRRVSGMSLGRYFKENFADPLGLDYWIGLPEEHEERTARMISQAPSADDKPTAFMTNMMTNRASIQHLCFLNSGNYQPNCREAHAAEIGGGGGSIGFADPECKLGFGYSMSKMGASLMLNERGQSLVDAVYKTLGYRTNKPGHWVK